ncbi:hypothetical protein TIFTF001_004698 [Ficus carica]|uniref:Uncharacterized protein n=1 Tax=Ficus carica TaxID=3494 RepID=A0AA87ZZ81_FICCA|nr:hypothetical protein TIFTF001_004698 [Ficus carica]
MEGFVTRVRKEGGTGLVGVEGGQQIWSGRGGSVHGRQPGSHRQWGRGWSF